MAHAAVLYLENFVESASRFLLATKKPFSLRTTATSIRLFFPFKSISSFLFPLSLAPHAGIGHVPAELSRLLATIRDLDERSVGE